MATPVLTTLSMNGDVDAATVAGWLDAGIALISDAESGIVCLDLDRVTFMDSTGLGMLVQLRNAARYQGGELALINVPQRVQRLFTITGLEFQAA